MAPDDGILMTMDFEGAGLDIRRVYWDMFYDAVEVRAGGRMGWITSSVTGPTHTEFTLGWLVARLDGDKQPGVAILAEAGRVGNEMYEIFHFPGSVHHPDIWVKRFVVTTNPQAESDVPGACAVKGSVFVTRSMETAQALVADLKAKATAAPAGRPKQE